MAEMDWPVVAPGEGVPVHDNAPDGDEPRGWEPVDLSGVLDALRDGARTVPARLVRDDGTALLYDGKVNGLHGESGSGKSWVAMYAAMQEVVAGRHVVYVDLEDSPLDVVARLLAMGADPSAVVERFHYLQPEVRFDAGDALVPGEALVALVREVDVSLVVVDSTGEALALEGVQPNADEEVARWFQLVPKRIAKLGPAVLVLDHLPKAGGGDLMPIGSQRKRASITGAQFLLESVTGFSKDRAGASKLVCAKDRLGSFARGQKVGMLQVSPEGESVRVAVVAPADAEGSSGVFRPTGFMERVSRELEVVGEPVSFNGICERVTGKRVHLRSAVDALVAEGYVRTEPGARGAVMHVLVAPFRESGSGREPVEVPAVPKSTDDRFRFLGGEPGTSHFTGSGNRSGTGGNRSDSGTSATAAEPRRAEVCRVCGQQLLVAASVAAGVCARRDEAHAAARDGGAS